jgi:hypothetical protein
MFPTFAGEIVASAERPGVRLTLRGTYTVPLGWLGRVGDSVAGRKLAHRVLDDHMERVAERLDEAVGRQAARIAQPSAELVDGPGSENFIG